MKMYCVEHENKDWENAYYKSKKVALAKAEFLKALMLNDEIEKERIFVTELQKEDGNEYFEVVKTIWYFDIWEETK